jgi:hypothetical protein
LKKSKVLSKTYTGLIILSLWGCSSPPPSQKTEEKRNSSPTLGWSANEYSIKLKGKIKKGACEEFKNLLSTNIKNLVLDSVGGSAREALCIAETMRKHAFQKSTVHGVCFESCALYLFLASPTRMIKKGLVGFQGKGDPEFLKGLGIRLEPTSELLIPKKKTFAQAGIQNVQGTQNLGLMKKLKAQGLRFTYK